MTQFVRFDIDDFDRFRSVQLVFNEIKSVKNLDFDSFSTNDNFDIEYNIDRMQELMPADVIANFIWPSVDELAIDRIDKTRPIAIAPPGSLLGKQWSLVRIIERIDSCEYSLDRCELIEDRIGELHIEAWSYPYGGLNALMALIEGFGFNIIGFNEWGEYLAFP